MEKSGYVYMLTNKPNGTLYVGVTNNLAQRVHQHKNGEIDGFSKKHALKNLVYYEEYPTIIEAIEQEKRIKKWKRGWKVKRILQINPDWKDLYETLNK